MRPTPVWLTRLALTFLVSGTVEGRHPDDTGQLEPVETKGLEVTGKRFLDHPVPLPIARPCPCITYDAIYDLENGIFVENEYVRPVAGLFGEGCNTTGVLELALASAGTDPGRRRVLVDLFFSNPSGYTFNLGDSITNDGWGGDANTQSRDAEVFSVNTNIYAFLSDVGGSGNSLYVPSLYSTRLTLIAGDGHLVWLPNNHNNFNYHHNRNLFALDGQSDTSSGGVNYDLYLGMNQVIRGRGDRRGSGLCKVGIKFLPEY